MKKLLVGAFVFTALSAFSQSNITSNQCISTCAQIVSGFGTFDPSVFIQNTANLPQIVSGFGTFNPSVFIQNTTPIVPQVISGFGTFDPSVFIQSPIAGPLSVSKPIENVKQ